MPADEHCSRRSFLWGMGLDLVSVGKKLVVVGLFLLDFYFLVAFLWIRKFFQGVLLIFRKFFNIIYNHWM